MRLRTVVITIVLALPLTSLEVLAAKSGDTSDTTKSGKLKGWARDKGGDSSTNSAPNLTITSPTNGISVEEGSALSFTAKASDVEDGDLSGAITWSPTGSNGIVTLPVGVHTVSASVTDSGGLTASEQITITVTALPVVTGSISFTWDIPAARENGEPLTPSELSGYEIYVTAEHNGENVVIAVNDPMTISHTMHDVAQGTYYISMSCIDTDGIFSSLSNIVTKIIQ